ncbi:DUF4142 domain-containing protein [Saccharothrix deserti]|uniref:DUF4142 domain-containing protein n=1 Tax=Saccharothrix deserti TaxID=2593674 RepID=UPI00131AEBFB|nr:DUF4142 domain-containing protein [Saccharothrix deserti]
MAPIRFIVACVVWSLALLAGSAGAVAAQPAPAGQTETTETEWGPLGPAGRDMLVKVQLAGLWEGPAGRLGLEKSANPKVKEASRHLIAGHEELDRKVAELGRLLQVELPTESNADQKRWIAEMTEAPAGSVEFDRIFANRLRAAHGGVFKFLAQVRSGTRNTLIRSFAERCMTVVLDHITVLEATGLVDFDDTEAIPLATLAVAAAPTTGAAAPAPGVRRTTPVPQPTAAASADTSGTVRDTLLGGALLLTLGAMVFFWIRGSGSGGVSRRNRRGTSG